VGIAPAIDELTNGIARHSEAYLTANPFSRPLLVSIPPFGKAENQTFNGNERD
jgi:hypothetical protein